MTSFVLITFTICILFNTNIKNTHAQTTTEDICFSADTKSATTSWIVDECGPCGTTATCPSTCTLSEDDRFYYTDGAISSKCGVCGGRSDKVTVNVYHGVKLAKGYENVVSWGQDLQSPVPLQFSETTFNANHMYTQTYYSQACDDVKSVLSELNWESSQCFMSVIRQYYTDQKRSFPDEKLEEYLIPKLLAGSIRGITPHKHVGFNTNRTRIMWFRDDYVMVPSHVITSFSGDSLLALMERVVKYMNSPTEGTPLAAYYAAFVKGSPPTVNIRDILGYTVQWSSSYSKAWYKQQTIDQRVAEKEQLTGLVAFIIILVVGLPCVAVIGCCVYRRSKTHDVVGNAKLDRDNALRKYLRRKFGNRGARRIKGCMNCHGTEDEATGTELEFYCKECHLVLCTPCSDTMHFKGTMATHTLERVSSAAGRLGSEAELTRRGSQMSLVGDDAREWARRGSEVGVVPLSPQRNQTNTTTTTTTTDT